MPPTGNPPVPAQLPRSPSAPEGCQALGGCALPLTLHHPPPPAFGVGQLRHGLHQHQAAVCQRARSPCPPPLRPSWLNSTSPVRPAGHRWMRWALRVGSSSTLCAVCAGLPRPPSHARSPGQGRGHHGLSARAWPGRDSSSPAQAVSPALPGPAQPLPSPHQCQTPGAHQLLLTHCPEVPCSPASSAGPVPCKGAAQRLCLPPRPGQQGSLRHPLPRGRTEPPSRGLHFWSVSDESLVSLPKPDLLPRHRSLLSSHVLPTRRSWVGINCWGSLCLSRPSIDMVWAERTPSLHPRQSHDLTPHGSCSAPRAAF